MIEPETKWDRRARHVAGFLEIVGITLAFTSWYVGMLPGICLSLLLATNFLARFAASGHGYQVGWWHGYQQATLRNEERAIAFKEARKEAHARYTEQ